MKVKAKVIFYDDNGIHTPGEIVDINPANFNAARVELLTEPEAAKKPKTAEGKKKK